jgi:putative hydrolase of the HAD superfamily
MIRQIWFDFGNVFIPVFPNLAQESFENRSVQLTQEEIKLLNDSLETGKLDDSAFFETIASSCKYLKSASTIKKGWNELLGTLSDQSLFLKKLRAEYTLCLVSNTNATHIKTIKKDAGPFLWKNFIKQFEALFFSYEIGHRKPNPAYFKHVLKQMNINPEAVLFIDDSEENIEAAAKLGMNTLNFNLQEEDLRQKLLAFLAKFN